MVRLKIFKITIVGLVSMLVLYIGVACTVPNINLETCLKFDGAIEAYQGDFFGLFKDSEYSEQKFLSETGVSEEQQKKCKVFYNKEFFNLYGLCVNDDKVLIFSSHLKKDTDNLIQNNQINPEMLKCHDGSCNLTTKKLLVHEELIKSVGVKSEYRNKKIISESSRLNSDIVSLGKNCIR